VLFALCGIPLLPLAHKLHTYRQESLHCTQNHTMIRFFTLLSAAILLSHCSPRIPGSEAAQRRDQKAFLKNISALCGQTFEGVVVFPAEPAPPFKDARLLMLVQQCGPKEWRIPFWVGEDKSRTWILTPIGEGLLFKHDHRHEDGTPDEVTNYGGLADALGSARQQNFPADAFTVGLIPAAATNVWRLRLSEDGKVFSYILERDGKPRFQADFDLSKPVTLR